MLYETLIKGVRDHMDEWHTTDDDGVRRCDFQNDCPLDQIQGSTNDWIWKDAIHKGSNLTESEKRGEEKRRYETWVRETGYTGDPSGWEV